MIIRHIVDFGLPGKVWEVNLPFILPDRQKIRIELNGEVFERQVTSTVLVSQITSFSILEIKVETEPLEDSSSLAEILSSLRETQNKMNILMDALQEHLPK